MILKINKDAFKNLSNGSHSLKVKFNDGFAETFIQVKDHISFTIIDTVFTATKDMTWSEWITSYGMRTSGNGIVWVSPDNNDLYLDCSDYPNWSSGLPLGSSEDMLYDSNDVKQSLSTKIINGMVYGRSSSAPA